MACNQVRKGELSSSQSSCELSFSGRSHPNMTIIDHERVGCSNLSPLEYSVKLKCYVGERAPFTILVRPDWYRSSALDCVKEDKKEGGQCFLNCVPIELLSDSQFDQWLVDIRSLSDYIGLDKEERDCLSKATPDEIEVLKSLPEEEALDLSIPRFKLWMILHSPLKHSYFGLSSDVMTLTGKEIKMLFHHDLPLRKTGKVSGKTHFIPCTWDLMRRVADLEDDEVFGFDCFSEGFEDRVRGVTDSIFADKDSGARKIIATHFETNLRDSVAADKEKHTVVVNRRLSTQEADTLRRHFPTFELKFSASVDGPHNFAAARRTLETLELVAKFPRLSRVWDIGGNWATHLRHGNTHVFSACPKLDLRDAARETTRRMIAQNAIYQSAQAIYKHQTRSEARTAAKIWGTWLTDPSKMNEVYQRSVDYAESHLDVKANQRPPLGTYCFHRAEVCDCDIKCDYAIMVHSGYDIPLEDLAKAMYNKGVLVLSGTMIADPNMLIADRGYLPILKVHWEKTESIALETQIRYIFEDDATLGYVHAWENVEAYLTKSVLVHKDAVFLLERDKYRDGTLHYTITRADSYKPSGNERLTSNAWLEEMKDKYVVQCLTITTNSVQSRYGCAEFKPKVFSKSLIDRVLQVCMRSITSFSDEKHEANMQAVMTHLVSMSQTIIINGVTVVRADPIDTEWFNPLVMSLYLEIYAQKHLRELGMVALKQGLTNLQLLNRKLGYFKDCLGYFLPGFVWDWITGDPKGITEFYDRATLSVPLDDYLSRNINWVRPGYLQTGVNGLPRPPVDPMLLDTTKLGRAFDYAHLPGGVYYEQPKVEERGPEPSTARPIIPSINQSCQNPSKIDSKVVKRETVKAGLVEIPYCDPQTHASKAMYESVRYKIESHNVAWQTMQSIEANVSSGYLTLSYQGEKGSLGFYSFGESKWLIDPRVYDHQCCFFNGEFVAMTWNDKVPVPINPCGDYLLVHDCTKFLNSKLLADAVFEAIPHEGEVQIGEKTIIDGVTGCGKTTQILEKMKQISDLLVLSVCKANVEEMRKANDQVSPSKLRTLDSYLLKPNVKAETLIIDEFGLAHAGDVYAAIAYSKASKIILFGDTEQIPFCSRVADFTIEYNRFKPGEFKVELREDTWRCPQDTTNVLKELYESKCINTKSQVEQSMKILPITSVSDVPTPDTFDSPPLYITQLIVDRDHLAKRFKNLGLTAEVRTVHAAQGLSYDNVVLVRLTRHDNDLFTSRERKAYMLVAVSRHKKTFVYATAKEEDPKDYLLKLMRQEIRTGNDPKTLDILGEKESVDQVDLTGIIQFGTFNVPRVSKPFERPSPSERAEKAANDNFPITGPALYLKEVDFLPEDEKRGLPCNGIAPLQSILDALDELNPGQTSTDDSSDAMILENSPLAVSVGSCRVDLSKTTSRPSQMVYCKPKLHTGALSKRDPSFRQTICAVEKRNANVPKLSGNLDVRKVAIMSVDKFFEAWIDPVKFNSLPQGVIGTSPGEIQAYYDKTSKQIKDHVVLKQHSLDKYTHMIKRSLKPVMDASLHSEYPQAATITYHDNSVTQTMTAVFSAVKARLEACKSERLCLPVDEETDVSAWINKRVTQLQLLHCVEIDFSKFDKSQDELHLLITDEILRRFGVDDEIVTMWTDSHRRSKIRDIQAGFSFATSYQRRTGDAFTLLGNTLVTLTAIACSCDMTANLKIAASIGDDVTLGYIEKPNLKLHVLGEVFNLSYKLLSPSVWYICSRYGVPAHGRIQMVMDPQKLLTKLGAKHIPDNEESLREVYTGLADCSKYLWDEELVINLCRLVQYRSGRQCPSLYSALHAARWCFSSFQNFKSLFEVNNLEGNRMPREATFRIR